MSTFNSNLRVGNGSDRILNFSERNGKTSRILGGNGISVSGSSISVKSGYNTFKATALYSGDAVNSPASISASTGKFTDYDLLVFMFADGFPTYMTYNTVYVPFILSNSVMQFAGTKGRSVKMTMNSQGNSLAVEYTNGTDSQNLIPVGIIGIKFEL